MLRLRLADGLPLATLDEVGLAGAAKALDGRPAGPGGYAAGTVRAHPARAGCSPTRWCATCCPEQAGRAPSRRYFTIRQVIG